MSTAAPLQILLVEDDFGHATLLRRALRRGGVSSEIHGFEDGEDLLTFLRGSEAAGEPTESYLLLMDLRLPRMGGLAALRELRADARLAELPVLVLSTTERRHEVSEARALGCPDLLTKPLDFEHFRATVQRLGLWERLQAGGDDSPDA